MQLQILQELLDISCSTIQQQEEEELLIEDWGNLNFINKKFKKLLQYGTKQEYSRYNQKNILKKTKGVPLTLGSDAIVNQIKFKNNSELDKIVKDDNVKIVVVSVDKNQIAFIRKYQSDYSTPPKFEYELFVDTQLLIDNIAPDNEEAFQEIYGKTKFIGTGEFSKFADADANNFKELSTSAVSGQTGLLLKLIKTTTLAGQLTAHAISEDERRLVKRKERNASRRMDDDFVFSYDDKAVKMPLQLRPGETKPVADNLYHDAVQRALMSRLTQFKKERAEDVTLEQMIDLIKRKGFLQDIKVKGIPYKLYDMDYMSMSNFTNKQAGSSKPSISYRVDDNSPEFKKVKEKAQYLKDLYDDEEELKQAYAKFMPPHKIRIELGFGPGGIVPTKVSESSW